jgi:hypothetical protein
MKILTDAEMAQIVHNAVHGDLIDCADSYEHFLEDLAELICSHFGGDVGTVSPPESSDTAKWAVTFSVNECVPPNGGVFKDYDTNVVWLDGVEA